MLCCPQLRPLWPSRPLIIKGNLGKRLHLCANTGQVPTSGAFDSLVRLSLGPDSLHLRNLTARISRTRQGTGLMGENEAVKSCRLQRMHRRSQQLWNPLKARLAHLPRNLSMHFLEWKVASQEEYSHITPCPVADALLHAAVAAAAGQSVASLQPPKTGGKGLSRVCKESLLCLAASVTAVRRNEMQEVSAVRVCHTLSVWQVMRILDALRLQLRQTAIRSVPWEASYCSA